MRHYSYSILGYLNGLEHDISINRTAEKSTCKGVLGQSSCDLYSTKSETYIRFFWNMKFGNNTCDDLRRDACYGINDDDTPTCLKILLREATSSDLLLINSIPTYTSLWCNKKLSSGGAIRSIFENLIIPNITSADYAYYAGQILLKVFPGRIIWISYPIIKTSEEVTNQMITKVNQQVNEGINRITNNRIMYLNLSPLLLENIDKYSDMIHHPGTLSEYVIKLIFSTLNLS